jgi:4-hydroxybutyrate CoA-transferase
MTEWCDASEAVQVVESGNRVFIQGACSTPLPLIEALIARGNALQTVEITHLHTHGPARYTDAEWHGHFTTRALFVAENVRDAVNAGRASYTPVFLSDIPAMFAPGGELPLDVAFVQVSPPDVHGFCSVGPSVDVTLSAVRHARHVVALVNPRVPRIHGDGFIKMGDIERAVRWEGELLEYPQRPPSEVHCQIGKHVAGLIDDGATLQLGIGAIPDAVLSQLRDKHDLGIHSEMFSDGVVDLVETGVITGARKEIDTGKIVACFVAGSRRVLDFADDNPMVELRPADYTNDTRVIRQLSRMVAINSAIEVDLTGQVCAESVGTRVFSGVGGQMDFLRGAALAEDGRPIIALPSTARQPAEAELLPAPLGIAPVNKQISRIVPVLAPGAAVTSTRAHVRYVVTEYGVAELHGRDLAERARLLISIAAPQFREQLTVAARALHLL